jgi:lysozyme
MMYNRQKLTDMLVVHEGCVLTVYQDSLGIDTIGIGRNIEHRGITDKELTFLGYYSIIEVYAEGITEDGARHLLENDISIVERELLEAHPCVEFLSDNRIIVLLNMAFNLGVPRLCKFRKMWAEIHEKDFDAAAYEMLDSKWARQVKGRATELADLMKAG